MFKKIAKLICPASKKIADDAAHSIATGYNGNGIGDGKRQKIARYSEIAKRIGTYQAKLDAIVADGHIDEAEEARISAALEPLIEDAKKIVFD